MSIILPPGKPSGNSALAPLSPSDQLTRLATICRLFVNASKVESINMLLSFTSGGKVYNEIILLDGKKGIDLPAKELHEFLHKLGENFLLQHLKLASHGEAQEK